MEDKVERVAVSGSPTRRRQTNRQDTWMQWILSRQMEIALSFVTLILAINFLYPQFSHAHRLSTYQTRLPTRQFYSPLPKFIFLSYLEPETGKYFKGNDDIYFVVFWAFVWLFLRELLMRWWFDPLATVIGVKGKGKRQRFAEQGWVLVYTCMSWSTGLRILLSYYPGPLLDIRQYWVGYPHDSLPALVKFYYLAQTAFWFQQCISLNAEKHRKDHVQMFTHHIITTLLVTGSYCINFTGLGLAIHTTMDLSDIFLSSAKMMKYAGLGRICDATFFAFLVSWIMTRHAIYLKIVWAIYKHVHLDLKYEWIPDEGKFFTPTIRAGFLGLLMLLQGILLLWLWMILRVLLKVMRGTGADDTRSDSEDGDEMEVVERDEMGYQDGQTLHLGEARKGSGMAPLGNGQCEKNRDRQST